MVAQVHPPAYVSIERWGVRGKGPGQFGEPHGICIDRDGNLLVTDSRNNRVYRFSRAGRPIGQLSAGTGGFDGPRDAAVDRNGNIYIVDGSSGRNDLTVMKVARDGEHVYFYARTRDVITPHTDPNWMMLFINVDCDHSTGWHGYDYVVNRRVADAATTFVERTKNGWNWQPWAKVRFRVQGNELMLAVPRQVLGLADGDSPVRFEFKWADHIQNEDSIDELTVNGDSAPNGRFNYLYVTDSGAPG